MPEGTYFSINPDAIAARVTWGDDSLLHDSGHLIYTVYVTFTDPALNPPEEGYWVAGTISKHYSDFRPEMAREVGQRFYDFLIGLRTLYGQESHILAWQKRFNEEHESVLAAQRETQDLRDQLRWKIARIKELETDYIRKLEADNLAYKNALIGIGNQANTTLGLRE